MHIVISDDYQNCVRRLDCFAKLRGHDVTIHCDTVTGTDALAERFGNAEAIVLIRDRTRIDAALLARLPRLRFIAQTGALGPHVDLAACARHGIRTSECSGTGSATSELTMLLILASLRRLTDECSRLKSGQWQGSLGRQLSGRKLGVFGFGRIGAQVAKLGAAFGAKVVVWGRDTTLAKAQLVGFEAARTKAEFFARCDLITLHLRASVNAEPLVSADDLACMKRDAILINTSRAAVIERGALERALRAGRPGFAAVDVYDHEPILGATDPLLQLPNCLCTPHLGFVERDNYEAYFGNAFDSIVAFANS